MRSRRGTSVTTTTDWIAPTTTCARARVDITCPVQSIWSSTSRTACATGPTTWRSVPPSTMHPRSRRTLADHRVHAREAAVHTLPRSWCACRHQPCDVNTVQSCLVKCTNSGLTTLLHSLFHLSKVHTHVLMSKTVLFIGTPYGQQFAHHHLPAASEPYDQHLLCVHAMQVARGERVARAHSVATHRHHQGQK